MKEIKIPEVEKGGRPLMNIYINLMADALKRSPEYTKKLLNIK